VNDSDALYGATLRQERALEHLADIREQVEAIYNHFSTPSHQPHADGGSFIRIPRPHDPPLELAVRVGEMIYNLRAALDYVVFEIAHHDSGVKQNGTQFPVEDRPEGFAGRRKSFLKGVSDEHVALIESYQPYEGCRWTTLPRVSLEPRQAPAAPRLANGGRFGIGSVHGHRTLPRRPRPT